MLKGLKEQTFELNDFMLEPEMELYLLKNGYDLGNGVCEPGKEHIYPVDSTLVSEYAIHLGYEVETNVYGINEFKKVQVA
jgi:hypothetical protein